MFLFLSALAAEVRSRFTEGQTQTLSDVFERYADPLKKLARGYLHNAADAEDAVHSAFLKIMRYPKTVLHSPLDELMPYLIAVVRHTVNDQIKKSKRLDVIYSEDVEEMLAGDQWNPEELMRQKLETLDLFNLKIPKEYSEILIHRLYYGEGYKEIAYLFDISESLARTRFSRACKLVRELSKKGDGAK